MVVIAMVNAFAYVGGFDFTTDLNSIQLQLDADAQDATTFRSGGSKAYVGGLRSTAFDMAGFYEVAAVGGSPDTDSFPDLGIANRVFTTGDVETETNTAYMFQAGKFSTTLFGQLGQTTPFSLKSQGTDKFGTVRGQLAKAKGTVSATGALGSGCNLGAASASQFLYASFHTFTAGTTITAVVESDTTSGFGAPTTRITIGPITTAGGTWATRLAGPLTDTWYRLRVTAITGTFTVAGAIAIQ
jgi:hypothetical protein